MQSAKNNTDNKYFFMGINLSTRTVFVLLHFVLRITSLALVFHYFQKHLLGHLTRYPALAAIRDAM